ncbi:MAG: hypothetical protein IT581_09215 [Verrucomicrobiales bacterium]|nr:hypothetical protein [Verrucomicrobiales bacterium]
MPVTVEARIDLEAGILLWGQNCLGRGTANSISLGRRLHVTVVEVEPVAQQPGAFRLNSADRASAGPPSLPTDEVLCYNMTLSLNENEPWRFAAGTSEQPPVAIGRSKVSIGPWHFPSLILPGPDRTTPVIMHASCRKLHGIGDDAVTAGLRHLETVANDRISRPSTLYLTGDQIYADDVHPDVLRAVDQLSTQLMGWEEQLPGGNSVQGYPAGRRGTFVQAHGFSSGHADNHLLGLGEFAAMHLLAWSGAMWLEFGARVRREHVSEPQPADAQRLLANVSTYMMFDDHEITDDWNLNERWRTRVRGDPIGRRVVANGLIAFGYFQGIGNNVGHQFLPLVPTPSSDVESHDLVDGLAWGFGWGFVSRSRPAVIVLDTRTHRQLDRGQPFPGLMNDFALNGLVQNLANLRQDPQQPVLIVSPAPVLGLEAIESIQSDLVRGPWNLDATTLDAEAWSLHRATFWRFMEILVGSGYPRFVFLSGDVHYGFAAIGQYTSSSTIDLVQLTSSATKNESGLEGTAGIQLLSDERTHTIRSHAGCLRWRFRPRIVTCNNFGLIRIDPQYIEQTLLIPNAADHVVHRVHWDEIFENLRSGEASIPPELYLLP